MSELKDFIIENYVLKKYIGQGGDVVIPEGIISIGYESFLNCVALTSITIPSSVTSVDAKAFLGCNSLAKVNYLGTIDEWAQIAFSVNYSNPICCAENLYINGELITQVNISTATAIAERAFESCKSLTSVFIGDSVESIGKSAFENCRSITSVVISNGVRKIGYGAFNWCRALKNIEIPDSVTSIDSAFSFCDLMYNVKDGLKYLGNSTNPYLYLDSAEDKSITEANIDGNCRFIGDNAFRGSYWDKYALTSVTIPNSVTSIGNEAFYLCTKLTNIVIPGSVKFIGKSAFENCISLTSVTIEGGETSIGISAFEGCELLSNVSLGDGVKDIGYKVFCGCDALESIVLPNGDVKTGGAFNSCKKLEQVTLSEKQIENFMLTSFGWNGRTICLKIRDKKNFETVCSLRRENMSQTYKYEKYYIWPINEESAFHYDNLLATGDYDGYQMTDNWRIRAIILRLRQADITIKADVKKIFVDFLKANFDKLIKLAKKLNDSSYIQTAIESGVLTEGNKIEILTKLKKLKLEGIEDIITNFS